MMEKFNGKYRIEPARLQTHDYNSDALYFVTVLTAHRRNYFGEIAMGHPQGSARLDPTPIGILAGQYWKSITLHFPFVEVDEYIIMPNHIHGILHLHKPDSDYRIPKPNTFGPQSKNLASVIRGFKAALKKYATMNNIDFTWQPRYHDSIIRSETSLNTIRRYIRNNPKRWILSQATVKPHNHTPQPQTIQKDQPNVKPHNHTAQPQTIQKEQPSVKPHHHAAQPQTIQKEQPNVKPHNHAAQPQTTQKDQPNVKPHHHAAQPQSYPRR